MRLVIGLVVAAAASVPAALFVAPAGEAWLPGANGKLPAVAVAGTDPPVWTTARRDRVVVNDDGVLELFALDGMLLYGRVENLGDDAQPTTRRWMRVVRGRQLQAQGIPAESQPVSIGREATGRVVVVLARHDSGPRGGVARLWLYDVARDAARRLRAPAEKGCVIDTVAVWRGRIAQAARCCRRADPARCSSVQKWRVIVRDGAGTTRVTRTNAGFVVTQLVLRNRSLAVVVSGGRHEQTLWRILDRGRRCPKVVGGTDDENGYWAGLGSGTLTWAIAAWKAEFGFYDLSEVGDSDLSGQCQSAPRKRYTAQSLLPQTTIHGSTGPSGPAIDGRKLYYATDTAIHVLRLPARRAAATSRERSGGGAFARGS